MPTYSLTFDSDQLPSASHIHLEKILDLDLQSYSVRCVGYAPSKRRRCRNPISGANCAHASDLLAAGDLALRSGGEVRDVIRKLAPLLLCQRNHQDQADGMVASWSHKVFEFNQKSTARVQTRQQISPANNSLPVPSTPHNHSLSSSSRSHTTHSHIINQSAQSIASQRDGDRGSVSMSRAREIPDAWELYRVDNPVSLSRDLPAEEGASPEQPITTPEGSIAVAQAPSLSPNAPASNLRKVIRKPIEGPCEICYEPLQEESAENGEENSTENETENEPADEKEEDKDEDTENENKDNLPSPDENESADEEVQKDEESDNPALLELVWCQDQCGKNFHKYCLGEWVNACKNSETPPTCPNCRTKWRDEE